MEALLTILTILAMVVVAAPFVIWIFLKFMKFHGEAVDNKGMILGIAFAICIPLFIVICIAVVFVGMEVDANTLILTLSI